MRRVLYRTFHLGIFDACENPWLVRFISQLWDVLDRYRVICSGHIWPSSDERLIRAPTVAEHERIVAVEGAPR
jgi:DNA-binding GntR family transcriptional regulator